MVHKFDIMYSIGVITLCPHRIAKVLNPVATEWKLTWNSILQPIRNYYVQTFRVAIVLGGCHSLRAQI